MRVVLVDPSRTVLKIVTRLLEVRNHEVRAFTDGAEAFEYTKSDCQISAFITSAELEFMSGLQLCSQIRALANSGRPLYVILMSSNQDRHKLIDALDNGADDFIGKPPNIEELYARLRAAERVVSMQRELFRLATTDPLTKLLNRRAFFGQAQEACARAAAGNVLSAIMFDIDHFKRVNDVYGHDVGDEALRGVANVAAAEQTIVGRLGGEEFAILLEHQALPEAVTLAESLRQKLGDLTFKTEKGPMTLTCSFGVSEWERGDTIDKLLKRADMALYKAKANGRNRVLAFDPTLLSTDYGHLSSVVRSR